MGIFDRMGRVISSNFNALLDSAEDPRKSVEWTLEEMKKQLKAARDEVVRGVAEEKQLKKKLEDLQVSVDKWTSRAELAVKSGDDQLAREALLQKRRVAGEHARAEQLRVAARNNALEMKAELERMQQRFDEFSARKSALIAKVQQAKVGSGVESLGASASGGAFQEFRRMEDQIEGVETALRVERELNEALNPAGPTGLNRDELEARFRALELGQTVTPEGKLSDVDEELSQLKLRVRVDSR
jgi:phage shock protein A